MRIVHSLLTFSLVLLISVAPVSAQSYTFTRFAGTGGGIGSDDGPLTGLRINPASVAIGNDGSLYFVESTNHTVRRIRDGVVTTIAGLAGVEGSSDGVGAAARFSHPTGIALDDDGNLYVADRSNHTIRKIITATRTVTTLAGLVDSVGWTDGAGSAARFFAPTAIDIHADGTLVIVDQQNHTIRRMTPEGVVTTIAGLARAAGYGDGIGSATRFNWPQDVALDALGNIYVADGFNYALRRIAPDGSVTTVAGLPGTKGTTDGKGADARFGVLLCVAIGPDGAIFAGDNFSTIREVDAEGFVRTIAEVAFPNELVTDADGVLYVADSNVVIRTIAPDRVVRTLAGLASATGAIDGPRLESTFHFPAAIARDPFGNFYVADRNNHVIRRIDPAGVVSTFAGTAGVSGNQNGQGSAARFNFPLGVATDLEGNVYVADAENDAIRKITPDGIVSTLAGGDFNFPAAVAVSNNGDVLVADRNSHFIQKVTPSGEATPFAGMKFMIGSNDGTAAEARFRNPEGIAIDGAGNVYVADTGNRAVRKISTAGMVSTIASGLASPTGIAVDEAGHVFVTELTSHTIRRIDATGVMTTIGGKTGLIGTSDGTGSVARFQFPHGIAVDGLGNLYVADRQNHRIQRGAPAIADVASIDAAGQLSASGTSATAWQWDLIRRPDGSTAELSSASSPNPTFTPDVADLYQFRLTASNAAGKSITTVWLNAAPAPGRRRAARH